jgi:iron complex outermembrane receptor protein
MGIAASTPTFDALDTRPNDTFLGEPDSTNQLTYTSTLATLEYQTGTHWLLKGVANSTFYDREPRDIVLGALTANGRTLNRSADFRFQNYRYRFGEGTAIGSATTGPIEHRLAVGASYQSTILEEERHTGGTSPIDILEPAYSGLPTDAEVPITSSAEQDVSIAAIFAQDQMALGPQVRVQLGVRYTSFEQTNLNRLTGAPQRIEASKTTPQLGIVYLPRSSLSVYASYSSSFAPTLFIPGDGRIFDPSTGEQFEGGFKAEVVSRQLWVTAAVFRLTREGVLSFFRDPATGLFNVEAGGIHRSSGVELDVIGQIAPTWKVMGSYAYLRGRVVDDPAFPPGTLIGGAPPHKASVWTTFDWPSGVGVGGGLFYQDEFNDFTSSAQQLPSRLTLDLTASYRVSRQLHARLNLKNVTNERYYLSGAGANVAYPAPPRTVQAQLLITF